MKFRNISFLTPIFAIFLDLNTAAHADIMGTVFRDNANIDGVQAGESGIAGVTITAYDMSGAVVGASTVSGPTGAYTIISGPGDYRLEFTNLPAGFSPSPNVGGTTTRFVSDGATADFAVIGLTDACDANPFTFTPCYISGDPTVASVGALDAAVGFRFNDSGTSTVNKVILADAATIGSTWGAAYDPKRNRGYLASVVRRHVSLGPAGEGGIYSIDLSDISSPSVSNLVVIPGTNPTAIPLDNASRDIAGDAAGDPSPDLEGFQAVGRIGLGDIDISADSDTLYVVNLGAQSLVQVDLTTNTVGAGLDIYDNAPTSVTSVCAKSEFRPWAVKVDGSNVFVGAVCSGESMGTLRAFILQLNPAGDAFSEVFSYDLPLSGRQSAWTRPDSAFGSFDATVRAATLAATQWKPWVGPLATNWPATTIFDPFGSGEDYVIHAQPILSDIEIDPDDGSLILGFNDRQAMIGGFLQPNPDNSVTDLVTVGAGDIIRVENTGAGFALAMGEYYDGELWNNGTFDEHLETAFGSLAVNPQVTPSEVMVTVYDPLDGAGNFNAGGTRRLSNASGAFVESFRIYDNGTAGTTFAKAAGLGDLEIACDTPIVVGDYVFEDTNQNGQQDVDEPGIQGVVLQIFGPGGSQVGPDITTGPNGEWISPELLSGTNYCIVLPASNFASGAGALDNFQVTAQNVGAENTDSDLGTIAGETGDFSALNGQVGYCFNSGTETNFDIDFGFIDASALPGIGNLVWIEGTNSLNGVYNPGGADPGGADDGPVGGVLVQLFEAGDDPLSDTPVTFTTTDINGCYELRAPNGDYFVHLPSSNFTTGVLAGTVSVTGNGGDDASDDDSVSGGADDGVDAISPPSTGISSLPLTLTKGAEVLNSDESGKDGMGDSPDEDFDYTVDFGFVNAALEPECIVDNTSGPLPFGPNQTRNVTFTVPPGLGSISASNPVSLNFRMQVSGGGGRSITDVTLQSPSGTVVTVYNVGNFSIAGDNFNVFLTDDAADLLNTDATDHDLSAPFSDRPRRPQQAFSNFDGDLSAGTWTLSITFGNFGGYTVNFQEAELCVGEATTLPKVGVGNLVFIDNDESGAFNAGDTPVEGVTLELLDNGSPIATAVTDPEGCYSFVTDPGTGYSVRVAASNFNGAGPLASVTGSVVDTGSAPVDSGDGLAQVDDQADENGIDPASNDLASLQTSGVTSATFELAVGTEPLSSGNELGKGNSSDDANDGDVDLTIDFGFTSIEAVVEYDYGDLPEGGNKDFPTAGTDVLDRPRHALGSGLSLGFTVDAEADGQPNSTATGDGADEDGFPVLPDLIPGETYTIPFTATVPGTVTDPVYLNAWIDFNCDGMLTAGEQIAGAASTLPGTTGDTVITDGANMITFTVPADATPGASFARFRLGTESDLTPTGDAVDGEVEDYLLTILEPIGAIGNYVWVDENSDGFQDEGERGIANVKVDLLTPTGTISTYTDSLGGYLFPNLPAGSYTVSVDTSTLPAGLTQTTVFTNGDGDFGNKDDSGYVINLTPAEVNLTADFGYNFNPTTDVDGGSNTAALGDRVWADADEDGIQDPNEPGISGVVLQICTAGPDGLFGTADDVAGSTQTTDANGYYLFDGLTPGAYVVKVLGSNFDANAPLEGLTQFGDPDHFGETDPAPASNDNQTTAPVVLGPGDSFLNVDFGYNADTLGSIGDRVWLDEDNSGDATDGVKPVTGTSEPGIAGVSVALASDLDGDGVYDLGTDLIIATDITDADGCYLFEGLPVSDAGIDYVVIVNDTDNKLAGLTPTYDSDGAINGQSAATLTTAAPDSLTEDFSYSLTAPVGSIGDTIWVDLDGQGGDQDGQGPEPGIEGVSVALCDADGNEVATTTTDSNGNYLFSNLPLGTYSVKVDTSTLPATVDPDASYDPDGPDAGGVTDPADTDVSVVTITADDPDNREQDFSYPPSTTATLGSIGDKVWVDSTAPGIPGDLVQATSELGLAGVTVTLTPPTGVDAGNGVDQPVTTVTDESGCYLFTDLLIDANPYTVTITPPAGFTNDSDSDSLLGSGDGTSQVTLTNGAPNNRDQDFTVDTTTSLFSIGNTVWFDANADSILADDPADNGGSESPISGVAVNLLDSSGNLLASQQTDSLGQYLFTNLPGGADYTVQVDTTTLPDGVSPLSTYERDDVTGGDSQTTVTNLSADVITEDFSYPPLGGLGDKIYFDNGTIGSFDGADAGLAGVEVQLTNAAGQTFLTTTLSNGCYYFGDLPAGTYTITVDPNGDTLPPGLTNTADPDSPGTPDGVSSVVLGAGEVNLDQDFGYNAPNVGSIGTLIWEDHNADGVADSNDGPDNSAGNDDDEPSIAGIKLDLYWDKNSDGNLDSDEPMFGTQVTTATDLDNYLFENLPVDDGTGSDMAYIVKVRDCEGILNGYWHSSGTADTDANSQTDAYDVVLSTTAPDVNTADFGYYKDLAKVGNYVWLDTGADGLQDAGTGFENVELTLTITYDSGDVVTVKTLTDATGNYSFCNLLADEDYNTSGNAGQPTFTIAVTPPADFELTLADQGVGADQDLLDSDVNGVVAIPVQGLEDTSQQANGSEEPQIASYDFGFIPTPKSSSFADFLVDNAALFNLDDNSQPGVPAIDPLTGLATGSTDTDGDDGVGAAQLASLGANTDGDVYNNLLEFALCFDPATGTKTYPGSSLINEGFHLEMDGSNLNAKFTQPTGIADVSYSIESSTDGQTWVSEAELSDGNPLPTGVTSTAGVVSGTTVVCFTDLVTNVGPKALLRLVVTNDAGSVVGIGVTGVVGYQTATITDFCQTYSDPLLEPCRFTGTINAGGVSGQVLDLSDSVGDSGDLNNVLTVGTAYYLEVVSGDNVGHIFDIASWTNDSVTLAIDADLCALGAPYSTKLDVPADLAGDGVVIRAHKTLAELFPIDDPATVPVEGFATLATGADETNTGRLLRYNRGDGTLATYYADGANWTAFASGDSILPPGEGIFVHNLEGQADFSIMQFGEVRTTQLVVPLCEGYNFVAPGHAVVDQSIDGGGPNSRQMNDSSVDAQTGAAKFTFVGSGARSRADQLQVWLDDEAIVSVDAHICYNLIYYLRGGTTVDQWSDGASATQEENANDFFKCVRSMMYCVYDEDGNPGGSDKPEYYIPSPISNTITPE